MPNKTAWNVALSLIAVAIVATMLLAVTDEGAIVTAESNNNIEVPMFSAQLGLTILCGCRLNLQRLLRLFHIR